MSRSEDEILKERRAYADIEEHAVRLVKEMESGDGNVTLTVNAIQVVDLLSGACGLLNNAPMGLGAGFNIAKAILEKCKEIAELAPAVAMLLLDTIMVCELLGTIGKAERDEEDLIRKKAEAEAESKDAEDPVATAAQAVRDREKQLTELGGRIHTEYLFMAMGSAKAVIQSFHRMGCFMRALKSGGTLADIKAASELLDRARNRMVQAIVTGKALGDIAAESVNMKDAQQAGIIMAPSGSLLLRASTGTMSKMYLAAKCPEPPPDSDLAGWRALLAQRPQCMAMTGKLEQCKRPSQEAYLYSDVGNPKKCTDERTSLDKHKLLCVCRQHGSLRPEVSTNTRMRRMLPALPDAQAVTELTRHSGSVTIGDMAFPTVLEVRRQQLLELLSAWGNWPELAKQAGACSCVLEPGKGPCTAKVRCFKSDKAAAQHPTSGRTDDVFALVGMCGKHARAAVWKSAAGTSYVNIYADPGIGAGADVELLCANTRELLGLSTDPEPGDEAGAASGAVQPAGEGSVPLPPLDGAAQSQ